MTLKAVLNMETCLKKIAIHNILEIAMLFHWTKPITISIGQYLEHKRLSWQGFLQMPETLTLIVWYNNKYASLGKKKFS